MNYKEQTRPFTIAIAYYGCAPIASIAFAPQKGVRGNYVVGGENIQHVDEAGFTVQKQQALSRHLTEKAARKAYLRQIKKFHEDLAKPIFLKLTK